MSDVDSVGLRASSSAVGMLSHRRLSYQKLLCDIVGDMENHAELGDSVLASIDAQLVRHRLSLRELEERMLVDGSLWTHPRHSHLESLLSEWHRHRQEHLVQSELHWMKLRREYWQAWHQLQNAIHLEHLLASFDVGDVPYWGDTDSQG